jgi:hypothetical protein
MLPSWARSVLRQAWVPLLPQTPLPQTQVPQKAPQKALEEGKELLEAPPKGVQRAAGGVERPAHCGAELFPHPYLGSSRDSQA